MKIFEVTPRQPKISKGVENAANNYFRKGNKLYYVEPNDNFGPGENELPKRLKKLGWKPLGNGAFSMVFENVKKPYVLKLTMAKDPAYMEYVRLINTHPNKYFPKISDMKILEVNGEKFGVYLIERLQTMKKPWNQIYAEILRRIMGVHDEEEGILTLRNTPAPHRLDVPQYQWEEILDQIDGNEELITAIKLVASWVNKRINRIDMHSGNIMQRSDGTVVITDPYAPLSTDLRYEAENEYQQGKEFYNTDSNYLKSSGDW